MENKIYQNKTVYDLNDTVDLMLSEDYKERFVGEYLQLKIRYEKLKKFTIKIEAANLYNEEKYCVNHADECFEQLKEPIHDCPYTLLIKQQKAMEEYLHILELRAEIEKIDLNKKY